MTTFDMLSTGPIPAPGMSFKANHWRIDGKPVSLRQFRSISDNAPRKDCFLTETRNGRMRMGFVAYI